MRFELTLRDIRCGTRGECCECPLAIMFRRYFPGRAVTVFPDHVRIGEVEIDLPRECSEFIKAFDSGRNPPPFSFHLEIGKEIRDAKPGLQGPVNARRR